MWNLLEQSDLDDNPFEMRSRIADWDPLTCKLSKRNIIDYVLDQKNDTIAAATELGKLPEELIKVTRTEGRTTDSLSSR
jgi:hypothetical protein